MPRVVSRVVVTTMRLLPRALGLAVAVMLLSSPAQAFDSASTITALRIAGTVTGGLMPASAPEFAQMVSAIQAGDRLRAATIAANSNYAASYLLRRLAFQMQNPGLDAASVTDNDATTFLMAHFVRASGTQNGVSGLWSENATYLVTVTRSGADTQVHGADLTAADLATLNWSSQLVRVAGQNAKAVVSGTATDVAIPDKHVGGYVTLSDRPNDNSFAMFGATAGTNLRMIEGVWTISTGLQVIDFASSDAPVQYVPRFVPEYDPNFFRGNGQNACISCHGGGVSSLNHGYSTVADLWDFDATNGLVYFATPTTATRKSLASDPKKRSANNTCNLTRTPPPVCNPDSAGTDPSQGWDLNATWGPSGLLDKLGWTGATSGQGLAALGTALGQARIVYQNFTWRVIREICPTGTFSQAAIDGIAADGKAADDIRVIVAEVAASSSCS
jgi:hypothetical protein